MFVEFIILYLRPVVNPIRVLINRIQLSVHLNNKHSNHLKTNFMNTLLLSTNTANCTTKNLKKIAAVICMTAVFVFTNTAIFAQGFSNSEGKTVSEQEAAKQKWVEENRDELNKTNTPTVVKPASVQPKSKVVATEKTVAVKNSTPVTSAKQVVTPQSAETIDNINILVVPAASGKESSNVDSPQVKVNKSVEARNNRPSAVDQLPVVNPYDKSNVVNEVNQNVNYPQIPGFVATGSVDADAKAFEIAKQNLQQSNPAEYNKYFSEKE